MNLNPVNFLYHIINLLILYFFLKWLLYKPVLKFMQKRQESMQEQKRDIESNANEAQSLKNKYSEKINMLEKEAQSMLEEARKIAQGQSEKILEETRQQANDNLTKARDQMEWERKKIFDDLKAEAVHLAIDLSKQIIQREISVEDHKKTIDDFIKKVG